MLQRLPIALAQIKEDNNSDCLLFVLIKTKLPKKYKIT